MGYLALLQTSNVLKNSILQNLDTPALTNMYRVVAIGGCKVFTYPSENSPVEKSLRSGTHVLVGKRAHLIWMEIISPIKGQLVTSQI